MGRIKSVRSVMNCFIIISLMCYCIDAGHADQNNASIVSSIPPCYKVSMKKILRLPARMRSHKSLRKTSDISFRLPKDVKPFNYDISLHPDLANGTFNGKVSILLNVTSTQDLVVLHQKGLSIEVTSLKRREGNSDSEVKIADSYPVDESENYVVEPVKKLQVGLYELSLSFTGSLRDKIIGFYLSKYRDENNRNRLIATSKFEPTYARQAFPCFDEPDFKATYRVKLVHQSGDGYSALSNMNIERTEVDEPSAGLTTVTFAKSVPMSTYIACFIVSDFVAATKTAQGLSGRTFPVSVYTSKAQKDKGALALDVGVRIIEYYIDLFGVDYPLPKMDMAAVPDFPSGALENWGLVTFRETQLLYDSKTSSTANKKNIITTVCHEFAHMWFGNLVTMKWWNDLWLNEGFATFIQAKGADAILPEWNFMDHFLINSVHRALAFDAKLSSHPIVQTVTNPDEITAIFDLISYQKGASVLRMLESFVGSDAFFAGVTKYLKKFAYGNAETKDLLREIEGATSGEINVTAIVDTWTRQMGYPVVNVEKDRMRYVLTQKRFLESSDGSSFDPSESPFRYKWTIPVTYVTSRNSTPTLVWFDKDAENLTIELNESVEWVKFNSKQAGYYRVNYQPSEWASLLKVLRKDHEQFCSQDRTHLLEDALSLANSGELDYATALDLTLYLNSEKSYTPWYVAANKLGAIKRLLSTTRISIEFRDYVGKLVDEIYRDVTWTVKDGDSMDILNLRTTILSLACSVGHRRCLEEVSAIFEKWINGDGKFLPHPDIRSVAYYYGINHAGGENEWNKMFEKFAVENNAAEKAALMNGLAGVCSAEILKKFINISMNEDFVRSQDAFNCLINISNNPAGTDLVWDWVRANWQFLVDRYTLNDRNLGNLIPSITKSFTTKDKIDEMKSFFAKYPQAGAGESGRKQAVETVETNIKWLESNEAKIAGWLKSQLTEESSS